MSGMSGMSGINRMSGMIEWDEKERKIERREFRGRVGMRVGRQEGLWDGAVQRKVE